MIRVVLSWGNPRERLIDVALRFTAPADDPLLWLPAWRPGRYLIQNFAANVREWSANLHKTGKSEWRVAAHAGEEVTVTYRYYAARLDAGSSFLDDVLDGGECYVNPSNLVMCVDASRGEPHTLTIAAPAEWTIESQLRREDQTLSARDYDHLIDSPFIAAASMTRHSFVEGGARFYLVIRGEGIDFEPFVEPLRNIVRAQTKIFGELPLREYRYLIHVGDRWHGVEHEESSSLIVRRGAFDADHFLSLAAHELFHIWNVKRIVPAAFTPYDYLRETPTRLLWAMEGITSYYGELSLVRAGIWTPERYLEHLRKEIELLESSPAQRHLSLAQASFDGWLQASMHDRATQWVDFYNKGEIVSALLDLALRREGRTLDDVMRELWRQRVLDEDAVARAAGLPDFFKRYVDGTEPLPYAELLATAGVAFESRPREGVVLGPGVIAGDEILAINGIRTATEKDVSTALKPLKEGESVEVLYARNGAVATETFVTQRDEHVEVKLRIEDSAKCATWLRKNE